MQVDKHQALEAFTNYVAAYDPGNPRIALKVAHTLRVARLCERISPSEKDLAWLCGLLHDIGRFEQVRRFDTFNDSVSVPHARLGAEVLFGAADPLGPRIREFVDDPSEDELIRTTIITHSDYRLADGLDERTRMLCDVLRDADKIDILKVNCICPIQDIYGVTDEDMRNSRLSPAVVRTFYEHRTVPRDIRQYPADILVGHICFAWELVFEKSRRIVVEQGHLESMLSRRFLREDTRRTFEEMATHMRARLLA
ncbi:MAG: HD domain-containing protein [Coriobacteriales bacterium]|nr:HD domain-containing protein [Coriobacteriales bacterium]